MDREKVINCLNDIEQIMATRQEICPQEELQYWIELQEGVADALAMLKEQDAVKPTWGRGKPFCGACGSRIHGGKFCSECGKPVKWDV